MVNQTTKILAHIFQFPFLFCLGNQISCFEKCLKTEAFTTEKLFFFSF